MNLHIFSMIVIFFLFVCIFFAIIITILSYNFSQILLFSNITVSVSLKVIIILSKVVAKLQEENTSNATCTKSYLNVKHFI